jgi:hypothetical protein
VRQGRLNFTTLADISEGAPVMTGIFSILNYPAVILFYSGASHSFISTKFSAKCQLTFYHTNGGITIATPGGRVVKGKCALGPFLSILVIECQHKCLNVNLCSWMDKVQIKSKGMFLSLSTLVLCTNILV